MLPKMTINVIPSIIQNMMANDTKNDTKISTQNGSQIWPDMESAGTFIDKCHELFISGHICDPFWVPCLVLFLPSFLQSYVVLCFV